MNHTPGPWRVGPLHVIWSTRPERAIADVRLESEGKQKDYNPLSYKECDANARLIAAAPDMYEALQAMLNAHTQRDGAIARSKAIDALAKAEGSNPPAKAG